MSGGASIGMSVAPIQTAEGSLVEQVPCVDSVDEHISAAFEANVESGSRDNTPLVPEQSGHVPAGAGRSANILAYRGAGAVAHLAAGEGDLMVNLKPGSTYAGFAETCHISSYTTAVEPASGSVLDRVPPRSLVNQMSHAIYAPGKAGSTVEQRNLFVESGAPVEGLVARLAAMALEHALVPFRHRLRAKKARSSYLCLIKDFEDGIAHTIQNMQELGAWAVPTDSRVRFCVFTGASTQLKGMALLSRICEPEGPLYRTNHCILDNFELGEVLMVGGGVLQGELPDVEVKDLFQAISEAFHILREYNYAPPDSFRLALQVHIHNLPLVNSTFIREQEVMDRLWQTGDRRYGGATLPDDTCDAICDAALTHLGDASSLDRALGTRTRQEQAALLGGTFKDVALRVPDNGTGLGTRVRQPVRQALAHFLLAGWHPRAHAGKVAPPAAGLGTWYLPDAPIGLVIGNQQVPTIHEVENVAFPLAGAAPYRVVAWLLAVQAADMTWRPAGVPAGWTPVGVKEAEDFDDDRIPRWAREQGYWVRSTGALVLHAGMVAPFVEFWIPISDANMPASYTPIPGRPRRVDWAGGQNLNLWGWRSTRWLDSAPHVRRFLAAYEREPGVELLAPNAPESLYPGQLVTASTRQLFWAAGIAAIRVAADLNASQNASMRAWHQRERQGVTLTTIASEYHVFMGGTRVLKDMYSAGGLWQLACLPDTRVLPAHLRIHQDIEALMDRGSLAIKLVQLRGRVKRSRAGM